MVEYSKTKEFQEKHQVVQDFYGRDLYIIVRLNALYDVLKKQGLLDDDELFNARVNNIETLYDVVIATRQKSVKESRWLDKLNPLSWF